MQLLFKNKTTDRCGCSVSWLVRLYRTAKEIEVPQEIVRFLEFYWIELKSLILAQIERWRHALHMQVER